MFFIVDAKSMVDLLIKVEEIKVFRAKFRTWKRGEEERKRKCKKWSQNHVFLAAVPHSPHVRRYSPHVRLCFQHRCGNFKRV
ncbi:unnamed protein product [Camellia sinensis]